MTYQRDPNDPVTGRKTGIGMRREDGSWGAFPAVLGVIFLLLVGLIAYNMYSGDTAGTRNPTASNSTSGATTNNGPTTPTPATPTQPAQTTPPATNPN